MKVLIDYRDGTYSLVSFRDEQKRPIAGIERFRVPERLEKEAVEVSESFLRFYDRVQDERGVIHAFLAALDEDGK